MNKKTLFFILVVAFVIRIAAVLWYPQTASDEGQYLACAHNLRTQHMFSLDGVRPDDSRAPLYPAYIASVVTIFGESLAAVRIGQALLDTLTCLLIFLCASRIWQSQRKATIALCVAALHPSLIASTTFILSETLGTALLTCALWLLIIAMSNGKNRFFLLSGIVLALATLCRPVTVPYPVFLLFLVVTCFFRKKKIVLGTAILCLAFTLTLAPWILRNYRHFDTFIPVSSNAGGNLWIGSYAPWNGSYNEDFIRIRTSSRFRIPDGKIGNVYIDNQLKAEALDRIKQDPRTYMRLCIRKVFELWGGIPGSKQMLTGKPFIAGTIYLYHYLFLTGFAYTLALLWKRKEVAFSLIVPLSSIAFITLIHAALVALPRYRIPIIPMVIVIAAYGISSCIPQPAKKQS